MKRLLLYTIILLGLGACSSEEEKIILNNVSLNCSLQESENKSGTKADYYRRGNAPAYISAVKVYARNLEYSEGVKSKTFQFNPSGEQAADKKIVFENLTVGNTTVWAEGICSGSATNRYHSGIGYFSDFDLKYRANRYMNVINSRQPVYADYYSDRRNVVLEGGDNDIDFSLRTDSHRFAVIVQNDPNSKYYLAARLSMNGSKLLEGGGISPRTADALVINDSRAIGTRTYNLMIRMYTNGGPWRGEYNKTITVRAGENVTRLYYFDGQEVQEVVTELSYINWDPIQGDSQGEVIY